MVAFPRFNFLKRQVSEKPFQFGKPMGTSATEIYAGRFTEEYLSKLYAEQGIAVFDEMRRSDGQVRMLLSTVKNPIKSASWSFQAVDETDEEIEIAAFAEHVIMSDISSKSGKKKPFSDFISEVLTLVEFGFSVFEITHKQVKGHKRFGDYLGLSDLGFRHQRSIQEWALSDDGGLVYVRQISYGDMAVDADIPGQFLLVFSNEKEGDNYEGISMLRPCYGAWYRKNIYRKLQAIGIERSAKGVPVGTMPEKSLTGMTNAEYSAQMTSFQALIDALSAHDMNGIVLGGGFDLKEIKLSHDADKVQGVINSENVEMSKAFLANFMELGLEQNGGSYSLGSDLSDIFLSGIEYMAGQICEKINLDLVQPLVRAKYGERDEYPRLTVKGINDKAGKEFADSVKALLDAGGLQKSSRLQKHLHEVYNLPSIDEDLAAAEDERLMSPPAPPIAAPPDKAPPPVKAHDHDCGAVKLTDAERSAFPVSAFIEDRAADLAGIMRDGLTGRSADMLAQMTSIIRAGHDVSAVRKAVLAVRMPDAPDYTAALRSWAGETATSALDQTLAEVGVTRKAVKLADDLKNMPKETRERIVQSVLLTAGYQDADLEKAVYFSFNENFLSLDDADTTIDIMASARARYFDKNLIDVASVTMASNLTNNVRNDVFSSDGIFDGIESFVFTNPAPQTAVCQSLVGRVFDKDEYESSAYLPPLHYNCKSYLVAQTKGRAGNKPINGKLSVTDPALIKQANLV